MAGSAQLYNKLLNHRLSTNLFQRYEYPVPDPSNPSLCIKEKGVSEPLDVQFKPTYTCKHCFKRYQVDEDGMQTDTSLECVHHPGHWWTQTAVFSCCQRDGIGCCTNKYHVNEGQTLLSTYENYVTTRDKPELEPDQHGIFALQSNFCFTTHGIELTRIAVLDVNENVVYNRLVKPMHPILHYNTKFTGLYETDFDGVNKRLADVQEDLLQIFSSKSILVGHDVGHHMKALKMFHEFFVDTCQLYPHRRGLPFKRSLATLMKEELEIEFDVCNPRDPKIDAWAALRLAKLEAKRGTIGLSN